jgi:quercetin 2,3-dioxygenase
MLTVRAAQDRGHADHGWLDSHHSFSFADYHDPAHMGFRALRVINEDRVAPGQGFGTHSHRDMEIVSYVLEGTLAHKDSLGTGAQIVPGEVQRMSAGTGVAHSEFNPSKAQAVHFLQIWLLPRARGIAPSYEQKAFPAADKRGRLCVVASPDQRDGSLAIHTDAVIYAGQFAAGEAAQLALAPGRHAWVQVAGGRVRVNGTELQAGDGAALSNEASVKLEGVAGGHGDDGDGEVLVFDLA